MNLEIGKASSVADQYISEYNIWMHHLLDENGQRLFPAKLRLISHWNLRDELKGDYTDPETGLAKQRVIQKVMERIVTQTIPAVVVDNPHVDWNPFTNEVTPAAAKDSDEGAPADLKISSDKEPDTRYEMLLTTFRAVRKADPYSPTAPTLIDRRFNENREIPEARVKAMLEQVLTSPLIPRAAALIQSRLGRPLEPFDIWYNGFRARGEIYRTGTRCRQYRKNIRPRRPTGRIFPTFCRNSDFTASAQITGRQHCRGSFPRSWTRLGAARREDKAHLRTRVEKTGMNYKGYNIAVHEMGHNVEQTFSLNFIDHTFLQGVPNTAFTEALAFVFQARDIELLGLANPMPKAKPSIPSMNFWGTYEIPGPPWWIWRSGTGCTSSGSNCRRIREATVQISKDIWNKYYAPVFQKKDVVLPGIYSHMIDSMLYLPDYPIGHMIAFQIEEQIEKSGNLGTEFERMARMGSVVPDYG